MSTIMARAGLAGAAATVWALGGPAGAAFADDLMPRDSDGLSPFDYALSFNNGAGTGIGAVFTPQDTWPATIQYLMFGLWIAVWFFALLTLNIVVHVAAWTLPLVKAVEAISEGLHAKLGDAFIFYTFGSGAILTASSIWLFRRRSGKAGRSLLIAAIAFGVGVTIAFPVAEAAKLLGYGRDMASNLEEVSNGKSPESVTTLIMDRYVRTKAQQWNFGVSLDSLGDSCRAAWTAKVRAGDADKIKDAVTAVNDKGVAACADGGKLHAYAMNSAGAFGMSWVHFLSGLVMAGIILIVAFQMGKIGVASIMHAGAIKPGVAATGFSFGQKFLLRNVIHGGVSALQFFFYVLLILIVGDFIAILAQVSGNGFVGEGISTFIVVVVFAGGKHFIGNLAQWSDKGAKAVVDGEGGGSTGGGSDHSGMSLGGMAVGATMAHHYASKVRRGASSLKQKGDERWDQRQKSRQQGGGSTSGGSGGSAGGGGHHSGHGVVDDMMMLVPEADAARIAEGAASHVGARRAAAQESARRYQSGREETRAARGGASAGAGSRKPPVGTRPEPGGQHGGVQQRVPAGAGAYASPAQTAQQGGGPAGAPQRADIPNPASPAQPGRPLAGESSPQQSRQDPIDLTRRYRTGPGQ